MNGEKVGEDATVPFTYDYENPVGGAFTWFAKAIDSSGLWGLSNTNSFMLYAPPSISITTPSMEGTLPSCNVYVQAIASSQVTTISRVDFYKDNVLYSTDNTAPYELKTSGWAAGAYIVKAVVVDALGSNSQFATVSFTVEAVSPLNLKLVENFADCQTYKIIGKLGPDQQLNINDIQSRTDASGNPWIEPYPETYTATTDSLEWELPLWFESIKFGNKLYYTLSNSTGCSVTDSVLLRPEIGKPEMQPMEPVTGIRFDANAGTHFICDNATAVTIKGKSLGGARYEVINPDTYPWNTTAIDTTADSLITIRPEWFANGTIMVRAVSRLGCPSENVESLNWQMLLGPTVWADTLFSYGGQPAIGKAYASGGTAPYTFTWSNVDTCFTANCDSVLMNNLTGNIQIAVIDNFGCIASFNPYINGIKPKIGWNSVLGENGNYSIITGQNLICGDIITSPIIAVGGVVDSSIQGGFVIDTNAVQLISQIKSTIVQKEQSFQISEFSSFSNQILGNGVFTHSSSLNITDNLTFSGNANSLFLIKINGDFTIQNSATINFDGISPSQVLWQVDGEVNILKDNLKIGYVLANGSLVVNSTNLTGKLYSESNLEFSNSVLNLKIGADKTGENVIFGVLDECTNTFFPSNKICNFGFETTTSLYAPGPNELKNLQRWNSPVIYGNNDYNTPDVFDSEQICSIPIEEGCYGIPENYYNINSFFTAGQGCSPDLYQAQSFSSNNSPGSDCKYVGISTGPYSEYFYQKLVDPPLEQNSKYLLGFMAMQAAKCARFPREIQVGVAATLDANNSPINGRSFNINSGILNASETWNYLCAVVNTSTEVNKYFYIAGINNSDVRGNLVGRELNNVSYTFIDNAFAILLPKIKPTVLLCNQNQINLLDNEAFPVSTITSLNGVSFIGKTSTGEEIPLPSFPLFSPPYDISWLEVLMVLGTQKNSLGFCNFNYQFAGNLSINQVSGFCFGQESEYNAITNVSGSDFEWKLNHSGGQTTLPGNQQTISISLQNYSFNPILSVKATKDGCFKIATKVLTSPPAFLFSISGASSVCEGSPSNYVLVGVPNTGYTYKWFFNGTEISSTNLGKSAEVTPGIPSPNFGEIKVIAINNIDGCSTIVRKNVSVKVFRLIIEAPDEICRGSGFTAFIKPLAGALNYNYTWGIGTTTFPNSDADFWVYSASILPQSNFTIWVDVSYLGCTRRFYKTITSTWSNILQKRPGFSYSVGSNAGIVVPIDQPIVNIQVCKGSTIQFYDFVINYFGMPIPSTDTYFWEGNVDYEVGDLQASISTADLGLGNNEFKLYAKSAIGCISRPVVINIDVKAITSNLTSVYLECSPGNQPLLKLQGYESLNYTLTMPDGTYDFGKDFPLSIDWLEGQYNVTIPHSSNSQCLSIQFRVLGGLDAPRPDPDGAAFYGSTLNLSGNLIVVGDVKVKKPLGVASKCQINIAPNSQIWVVNQESGPPNCEDDGNNSPLICDHPFEGQVSGPSIILEGSGDFIMGAGSKIDGVCQLWRGIKWIAPLNNPNEGVLGKLEINGTSTSPVFIRDALQAFILPRVSSVRINYGRFLNCINGISNRTGPGSQMDTQIELQTMHISQSIFRSQSQQLKYPFTPFETFKQVGVTQVATTRYSHGKIGLDLIDPLFSDADPTISHFNNNVFENWYIACRLEALNQTQEVRMVNNQFRNSILSNINFLAMDANLEGNSFDFSYPITSDYQGHWLLQSFPDYQAIELPYGIYFANGGVGSLRLSGFNQFEGPFDVVSATSPAYTSLTGTAIRLAGQNFNLSGARISKWRTGILVRETTAVPIISQNRFFGNQTAIDLSPIAGNTIDNINLNLRCNRFDNRYILQQPGQETPFDMVGNATGLRVGTGVDMQNIGGQGGQGFDPPAGNWWPVGGSTNASNPWPPLNYNTPGALPSTINGWFSPLGWNSIVNESNSLWNYWSFRNEFLGNFQNPTTTFDNPISTFFLKTDASQADPITIPPTPANQILVNCGNFGLIEVFPTRQAVDSTLAPKPEKGTWLGQNIPNPGCKSVSIPYSLAEKAERVWLEVYDLGTGRILQNQYLPNEGIGSIEMNLSRLASGFYGYRLMVDGQAKAWKKLAITR